MATDNKTKFSLLIIEDNLAVARNIADFMEPLDYGLDFAVTGKQGLKLALEHYYDVIVLDLMLPEMDGIEVCQQIRQHSKRHIPILMLTARDTIDDKLLGFATGADDYLTKPFALEELNARCLVLAKRPQHTIAQTLICGNLKIDRANNQVTRSGVQLQLQPIPFQILLILAESHPRIVSRTELWTRIWGDSFAESDVIRSHVYQLRQALDKPFAHPMLVTVHGVGFKLSMET